MSNNIQDFHQVKKNLYKSNFETFVEESETEETNQNEKEIKIKLNKQETYFEIIYELFSKTNLIIGSKNELQQLTNSLLKSIDNFIKEFIEHREDIIIQMNELLTSMKENDKKLRKIRKEEFTEEYEKMNYSNYYIESEKEKRKIEEQRTKKII